MRLWLCFNCQPQHEFDGGKGICPKCGADHDDPKSRGAVAPRVVIHFDPPHAVLQGRGIGCYACDPTKAVGSQGTRATGDPRVVNCPACKLTTAWKAAIDDINNPPAYRVPSTIKAENKGQ
jgi:hypothetical protein